MRAAISIALIIGLAACGSSGSATNGTDAGSDAGGADANGNEDSGGNDAGPGVPSLAPASIAFNDLDPVQGNVNGVVSIGKASDETDITTYNLYWGKTTLAKLSPIATIPKTGSDITYTLTGPVPSGAGSLVVFSANASGEMATGVSTTNYDAFAVYTDISSGMGVNSGSNSTPLIDTTNNKLLVINDDGSGEIPALIRCNLDATGCAAIDISAGQAASSGIEPSPVIDSVNQKLLVAADNTNNNDKLALYRCNLDGTSCTYTDISAGQVALSAYFPSAVIDTINQKLLVVTENGGNHGKPLLFRLNLDGTSSAAVDISAAQGNFSGVNPRALFDATNQKLLVVTDDSANADKPALFRCNLDGTSCAYVDISAGQGTSSGLTPSAIIDTKNQKLLVVTADGANSGKPGLFRCNLDGTSCTFSDISAARAASCGTAPFVTIDAALSELVIVTQDDSNETKPALFRCNLDGTACAYGDISAAQASMSGRNPSATIDTANGTLFVVTDGANSFKSGLFSFALH